MLKSLTAAEEPGLDLYLKSLTVRVINNKQTKTIPWRHLTKLKGTQVCLWELKDTLGNREVPYINEKPLKGCKCHLQVSQRTTALADDFEAWPHSRT